MYSSHRHKQFMTVSGFACLHLMAGSVFGFFDLEQTWLGQALHVCI